MKVVSYGAIVEKVRDACMEANFKLADDVRAAVEKARGTEESPVGREILDQMLENAAIAEREQIAICQDTGFAVFFVELGDRVSIEGGLLVDAINEGVRQGYRDGYLRKSICHPLTRKNTGDNTPAIVHLELVPGDTLKILLAPKGAGSENMSRVAMLKPSDGLEGIKTLVIDRVREAGANPCPPGDSRCGHRRHHGKGCAHRQEGHAASHRQPESRPGTGCPGGRAFRKNK